ncbi:hypothetical protein HaLaN_01189 [Haematococcus lacustris]|uniref:Uncharacterized protein n=1 Tax=Haematococcus lacustris TaxID=44745 RepID=A0A699YB32_HAELA|nr:hypothetical protein HaLaN_01189 [Haematococcus lacustris]
MPLLSLDALILPCGHCCSPDLGFASAGHCSQYDVAPRPKQDLEQLVSAVEELRFLSSSSQVQQTSQLLWCFADWARQPENSRARMTQIQCNAVLDLLQHMAGEGGAGTAGDAPALPPLQQFAARQLNMAAWSLGKLKPHLPAAAYDVAPRPKQDLEKLVSAVDELPSSAAAARWSRRHSCCGALQTGPGSRRTADPA